MSYAERAGLRQLCSSSSHLIPSPFFVLLLHLYAYHFREAQSPIDLAATGGLIMSARLAKARTRALSPAGTPFQKDRLLPTKRARLEPTSQPKQTLGRASRSGSTKTKHFTAQVATHRIRVDPDQFPDALFTFTHALAHEIQELSQPSPTIDPEIKHINQIDEDLEEVVLNHPASGKVESHQKHPTRSS